MIESRPESAWRELDQLVLVAGHAVYLGHEPRAPEDDDNWALQPFQRGEPAFYIQHVRAGVEIAAKTPSSLLVFSGGQTRKEAGPRSEGQGYRHLAEHFRWWSLTSVTDRATTEEYARDSFENLLFGICRFRECTGRYPAGITVVSWRFKEGRFALHREALRLPERMLDFQGANQPADLVGAMRGEARAVAAFGKDPYGAGAELDGKRAERNPFDRWPRYHESCPEIRGLLRHRGPQLYEGPLPWK